MNQQVHDATERGEKRYWDRRFKRYAVKLLPGDFHVANADEMLVTVLGSCVSACIRDKVSGIGGMNHFLLTHDRSSYRTAGDILNSWDSNATRYGTVAMEVLINHLLKKGAQRSRLEAKIFGGGRITGEMSDIGADNIAFVKAYLMLEKIPLVSSDVGGTQARRIYYLPDKGDVFVKKIQSLKDKTLIEREKSYSKSINDEGVDGEVYFLD